MEGAKVGVVICRYIPTTGSTFEYERLDVCIHVMARNDMSPDMFYLVAPKGLTAYQDYFVSCA